MMHSANFARNFVRQMQPVYEGVKQCCEAIYGALWKSYMDAGAPYGESDEGMWRWLRECAEVERLRREAGDIEIRHRQMADFRKMLAERTRK